MTRKAATALATLFCLGSIDFAAAQEPPRAEAQGGEIAASEAETTDFRLDYEKFTLDNGLEVVLQVDKSDPIVAFSTVVHVGSNREKPGRTGFAHFFEHMAFNDSENVPRGWGLESLT